MSQYERLFEIQDSPIAGKGVFACVPIPKGSHVHTLAGDPYSLDEMVQMVLSGQDADGDQLLVGNEIYLDLDELSRTFNHSCDPNCFVRGESELVSIRDIAPGEELSYDYSTTMNDNREKIEAAGDTVWTCPCACGSAICRKIIDQFATLPTDRQCYYLQNRYLPDFMFQEFQPKIKCAQ